MNFHDQHVQSSGILGPKCQLRPAFYEYGRDNSYLSWHFGFYHQPLVKPRRHVPRKCHTRARPIFKTMEAIVIPEFLSTPRIHSSHSTPISLTPSAQSPSTHRAPPAHRDDDALCPQRDIRQHPLQRHSHKFHRKIASSRFLLIFLVDRTCFSTEPSFGRHSISLPEIVVSLIPRAITGGTVAKVFFVCNSGRPYSSEMIVLGETETSRRTFG